MTDLITIIILCIVYAQVRNEFARLRRMIEELKESKATVKEKNAE
jgi:hypothetical protein